MTHGPKPLGELTSALRNTDAWGVHEGVVRYMSRDSETGDVVGQDFLRLSADVVAAYLAQNSVQPQAIPDLIRSVHQTLSTLGQVEPEAKPIEKQKPAVPIARSIHDDYIVCLEDGKKLKMLKRYLRSKYDLSPEAYRRKWNLAPDYPMVAPAYAARRSDFAKQIGLGRGVRKRRA
jgi:predicted transcriptional regulator